MKPLCPEDLVLLGAAVAIQISKEVPDEELEVLAALYTVIGDQLALILATRV